MRYYQDSAGLLYYQFGTDTSFYSHHLMLNVYVFCIPLGTLHEISYKKAILLGHDE